MSNIIKLIVGPMSVFNFHVQFRDNYAKYNNFIINKSFFSFALAVHTK